MCFSLLLKKHCFGTSLVVQWLRLCASNMGFPGSSSGKESTCNAGDPGLIPGLRRSPGEGMIYSLQYSWASLVAQMVKTLPAMQQIWVWSLGHEGPLERETATHSSILACRIPWTEELAGYSPWGWKESDTTDSHFHFLFREKIMDMEDKGYLKFI